MTVTRTEVADVVAWAKDYDGPLFHSLGPCDPPYHLTTITKRFGKPGSAPAKEGTDGLFARASRGFMGKVWDGGDIAFRPETWAAFLPLLHRGAFGMAFASSRGWHRLAVAIEDAGYVIHPSIFLWTYGTGFPKATRIDTQIDRDAGAIRETRRKRGGRYEHGFTDAAKRAMGAEAHDYSAGWVGDPAMESLPATDLAKAWEGHRYGLQALKPAAEPIIVFQKPYEGRPVDDITRTGAGALNVDGGRIAHGGDIEKHATPAKSGLGLYHGSKHGIYSKNAREYVANDPSRYHDTGRWPSNFALVHHPDCGEQCVEGCPVAALDAQAGPRTSGVPGTRRKSLESNIYGGGNGLGFEPDAAPVIISAASGGASRFFHSGDWQAEAIENADPVLYAAKASVAEREAGLHLDGSEGRRCTHPTIKPISLVRWLATLLLPPEQYAPRRILIPFSGVASEMIGAGLAGWEEVQGVELSKEYAEIGAIRLEYWLARGWQMPLFAEGGQNEG